MPLSQLKTADVAKTADSALIAALLTATAVALWPADSLAVTVLSAGDLSSIGSAVAATINRAKDSMSPNSTQTQIDAGEAAALTANTEALISQYAGDNAMAIAEAVIAAADADGVTPFAIGKGLANAALAENSTVGLQIADAVGSTASGDAVVEFVRVTMCGHALGTCSYQTVSVSK